MDELIEGTTFKVKLRRNGSSAALIITKSMIEYLGITDGEVENAISGEEDILLMFKADKGDKGRFIAFWKSEKC